VTAKGTRPARTRARDPASEATPSEPGDEPSWSVFPPSSLSFKAGFSQDLQIFDGSCKMHPRSRGVHPAGGSRNRWWRGRRTRALHAVADRAGTGRNPQARCRPGWPGRPRPRPQPRVLDAARAPSREAMQGASWPHCCPGGTRSAGGASTSAALSVGGAADSGGWRWQRESRTAGGVEKMSAFFSIGRSSGKQKENRNETVRWMRNEWYMVWWLIFIELHERRGTDLHALESFIKNDQSSIFLSEGKTVKPPRDIFKLLKPGTQLKKAKRLQA
jgi:hypothetical protein